MTVIRPNSISGITSLTAHRGSIDFYAHDGSAATFNNINSNVTSGVSTFASLNITGDLDVGGALTYEDVTNIDSVGVITARSGIHITGTDDELRIYRDQGDRFGGLRYTGSLFKLRLPAADHFTVDDSSNNERLRITSAGNLQVKGGNLHLDSNAELALFEDNTSGSYTNSAKIAFDFSGNIARMRSSTNGSATIRPLAFYIANTPAILIGTDGKVGINETSPTAHLVVKQSGNTFTTQSQTVALFQRSSTAGHGAKIAIVAGTGGSSDINFGDTADEDIGIIQYYHTDNSFRFTTNTSERLRITDSGMVGINMTPSTTGNSTYMLQMYNAGSQCFMSLGQGSGNGPLNGLVMGVSNAAHYITGRENLPMIFATNDTERLRITDAGKIGVGVASPAEMMEITNTGSTGSQIQFRDTSTGTGSGDGARFGYNGSGAQIWNFENTYTRFATNNNERLRILSNGHVNIGGYLSSVSNSGLHVGRSSGGTAAGESVIAATLGNDSTMVSALLTVKNAGNRGAAGATGGSPLAKFEFNNGTAFEIDKNGYRTLPYQPCAMAYNAQGQHMAGGAVAQFNSTRFNIGNMYNTSNGRMTVPVDGRYLVAYSGLHDYISQNAIGFDFLINGSNFDGGEGYQEDQNISNSQLSKTLILHLSANDYVQIYIRSSGTQVHQRYGSFSMCLLT